MSNTYELPHCRPLHQAACRYCSTERYNSLSLTKVFQLFSARSTVISAIKLAYISCEHAHIIFWVISFPRINTVLTGFFWSLSMSYLTNNTGVPKPEIIRPKGPFTLAIFAAISNHPCKLLPIQIAWNRQ